MALHAGGTGAAGLTAPVLINQGGTGATTAAAARAALASAASGANADITGLAGLTTPLSVPQGGTGAITAAAARTALASAASGANADITSLAGMTTPLSVPQGGTGNAGGAWTSVAITVSGTGTPGAFAATGTARYQQVGKKVDISVSITVTNSGTVTSVQFTFPIAPLNLVMLIGRDPVNGFGLFSGTGSTSAIQRTSDSTFPTAASTYNLAGSYEAA